MNSIVEKLPIRGFARVQLTEDGKVIGDSGWHGPNTITNVGFLRYLVNRLGGATSTTAALSVGYVALGTGGATAASDTLLPGEVMTSTKRTAVTFAATGSKSAKFTATFNSGFVTKTYNISNIGLYSGSNTSDLFAGNTFASSTVATNQSVNITYQINFA